MHKGLYRMVFIWKHGGIVDGKLSQHSNPNYSMLHNTIFPTNEYGCIPLRIINKRFYKMLSSMPYWDGPVIRLNDLAWVVSGGVNGALYKPSAVIMQTLVLLDTYLGQAKVCIWALHWEKSLDRKEKVNFGVDVDQLPQVRGLWGVTLSCQHWPSPHVLLEENHHRNKSWPTGYKPALFCSNLNRRLINIAYLVLI